MYIKKRRLVFKLYVDKQCTICTLANPITKKVNFDKLPSVHHILFD
jgi:hypothetical protein